jgi:hypothetical protein
MIHVWDYVVPHFKMDERRQSRISDLSTELNVKIFQIFRWPIVATLREIRWCWWPVAFLTYLKDQSHTSGQVIHEVAVEEPHT